MQAPKPRLKALPAPLRRTLFYRSSPALVATASLAVIFLAVTALRVSGRFTQLDLRIVAHIVPVRYHPRLLATLHPLVHVGDAVFVVGVISTAMFGLWISGYRSTWALLIGLLSWPAELACKSVLSQPDGLGQVQATVSISSLVHGSGGKTAIAWLRHAAPDSVNEFVRNTGVATLNLTSSYPSGTTARGAFALGLLAWLAMRIGIPVLSELAALLIVGSLLVLGLATVLFAWHWPSDVLGGYILGAWLLACAIALIKRPIRQGKLVAQSPPPVPSSHGRLRWVHD